MVLFIRYAVNDAWALTAKLHQTLHVCIDNFYPTKSLPTFVRSRNALVANFVFLARKREYRLHMRTREFLGRLQDQRSCQIPT